MSESELSGSIIRFEQVRGRGDAEIARLAELQHGHVHLHQLRAAGIKRGAILHRIQTGRLHATLPAVYLVGRPQRDVLGRMMAAALYFRGDGLVTGRPGAQAWRLLDTTRQLGADAPISVLLVGRNATAPPGVVAWRTQALARQDVRWRQGIPLTSPARTILDCAREMNELELESVLAVALGQNMVRRAQLKDVMERNSYAKGIGVLRQLLAQTEPLHDTRSEYERKLLELLRAADLPLPITNTWVAGQFVDGVWPDLKLVLEFDGWKYHGGRSKFETDRLRDQHLIVAGHQTMRITARQIDQRPHALIARIASAITTLRLNRAAGADVGSSG